MYPRVFLRTCCAALAIFFSITFYPGCSLLLCSLAAPAQATNTVIHVNAPSSGTGDYELSLLRLALEKIHKPYEIRPVPENGATQARIIELIDSGQVDLFWAATSLELEKKLTPVRIPLYKGLLGYRVLLIRRDDQPRFQSIKTAAQLKTIKLGQGKTWADTDILSANGFTLVTSMKYPGLFHMLDGGRFDAFPRGIQEPWAELRQFSQLNLAVEQSLLLRYKMPLYFFTSNANQELARDIEAGLNLAIADGSFDRVFWGSPLVQDILRYAQLPGRTLIDIDNPHLPPKTPLDRRELWVDFSELIDHANHIHF